MIIDYFFYYFPDYDKIYMMKYFDYFLYLKDYYPFGKVYVAINTKTGALFAVKLVSNKYIFDIKKYKVKLCLLKLLELLQF